jgi:excisionase family DNA binding protein
LIRRDNPLLCNYLKKLNKKYQILSEAGIYFADIQYQGRQPGAQKGLTGFFCKYLCCGAPWRTMEKFCIVKRRREGAPDSLPLPRFDWKEALAARQQTPTPQERDPLGSEGVLSLSLTPGQSRAIRDGGILPLLATDTGRSLSLELQQRENGAVVFNFHIDPDHNLMMFKPDQVCRMMQISRHLLNRLVKENKIKSHKVGRLRRFCLKDIIEALNRTLA